MKLFRSTLGEFEELILLMVAVLDSEAYGVSIQNEIEKQTGRSISISAIHSSLHRLQTKGYLISWMGGQSLQRGGRRKKYFKLTGNGNEAIKELKNMRDNIWKLIPDLN